MESPKDNFYLAGNDLFLPGEQTGTEQMNLLKKIDQYKTDGRNLFSNSEKIMAALVSPDLYQKLMPEQYQHCPLEAFFKELDGDQRAIVCGYWRGQFPL